MPRIRSIKPKFWDDIKLSKISRDARLLFIGLWNFCDDVGVIVAEHDLIKSKVFPYDKLLPEQLGTWLQELIDKKLILLIEFNEEKFFAIKNFTKHQKIDRPNFDELHIDKQTLAKLIKAASHTHSHINQESFAESSTINQESFDAGGDRKGGDRIGRDGIAEIEINEKRDDRFQLWTIYDKDFSELKKHFKNLTEEGFLLWKKFVDFIIKNNFNEIFECKFVTPPDFQKLVKNDGFSEDKWEAVVKKLLSTGIEAKHNLFFRIPDFIGYTEKGGGGKGGSHNSEQGRKIKFD